MIMATEPSDPYAILGVARDATQAQISAAYRALLRRYHPDTRTAADTSGDETSDAALQHVLIAYTVLRDPARRSAYDRRTAPRTALTSTPAHSIHLSWIRAVDDPPLRVGPVHWTPWVTATIHGTGRRAASERDL
jgi:curved DNA-binding protein CbpA